MSSLLVPTWFPSYFDKIRKLDAPAAKVLKDKLRQIRSDPSGGMSIHELSLIPAPQFTTLAELVKGLFDTTVPGQLSGLPETAIHCVFDEVLLEGAKPPPRPTRSMVLFVPHSGIQGGLVLKDFFPTAKATDVAAVLHAPVWVRSEWLLIDPLEGDAI